MPLRWIFARCICTYSCQAVLHCTSYYSVHLRITQYTRPQYTPNPSVHSRDDEVWYLFGVCIVVLSILVLALALVALGALGEEDGQEELGCTHRCTG